MRFVSFLFLPFLFLLLFAFHTQAARAAGGEADQPDIQPDAQVLINMGNMAAPPPVDEYNDFPPGKSLLMTGDEMASTGGAPPAPDEDVMTIEEIVSAYQQGRYDAVATHIMPIANNNYPQAQELLGIMYSKGQGVTQDDAAAADWLTKAAEAGRPLAEHYLATLTYAGKGVPQDSVTALMWLYLATAHYPDGADKERAMQDRADLSARLSRRDRLRAYEMAHDWLKRKEEADLLNEEAAPQ